MGQARKRFKVDYPLLYASPYVVRGLRLRLSLTRPRGLRRCSMRAPYGADALRSQKEGAFLDKEEVEAAKLFNCYQVRCGRRAAEAPWKRLCRF